MLFECGEAAFFEPWQLNGLRLGRQAAQSKKGEQEGPGARARRQEKAGRQYRPLPRGPFRPSAMLFECGEAAFFQPWQLNLLRLGRQAARARRESKKGQEQEQEGRRKQRRMQKR